MTNNLIFFLPFIPLLSLPIYIATRSNKLHHGANLLVNCIVLAISLYLTKEILSEHT